MTDVTVRLVDPDRDPAAVAALATAEFEFGLHDAVSMRHVLDDKNPRKRKLSLVAERDGAVIGYGVTSLDLENSVPGAAVIQLVVTPGRRREGVGSAIYDRLAAHWNDIGATVITGRAIGADGVAFNTARGFVRSRSER
ncbi:MAG: GNAT family N-acetyltransferase, partial [Stackebrandtia sp.]